MPIPTTLIQAVRIDGTPPFQNALNAGRLRDRIRRKEAWRLACTAAIRRANLLPVRRYPVSVRVSAWFGKGQRRPDADGLAGAAKVAIDCLRGAGILANDAPDYVATVVLGPCERGPRSVVEITIVESN